MTPKPNPNASKASPPKAAPKSQKGAFDTARLFVHVDEVLRRTQSLQMTRYVE
jgi:hypothetical protein